MPKIWQRRRSVACGYHQKHTQFTPRFQGTRDVEVIQPQGHTNWAATPACRLSSLRASYPAKPIPVCCRCGLQLFFSVAFLRRARRWEMCLPFRVSLCRRPDPLPALHSGQRGLRRFILQKEVIALFVPPHSVLEVECALRV